MSSVILNDSSPRLAVETIPEALERSAASGAFVWTAEKDGDAVELPMAVLLERANRVAQHLLARGLPRGARVVVMLPTGEDWLSAFFGTLLAGGVAVPVGPNLSFGGMDRYAETVRAILDDAGAKVLVGSKAIEPWSHAFGDVDFVRVPLDGGPAGGALDGHPTPRPLPSPSPGDPAIIQYTSGTTGRPKGVVLSHRALLVNAWMIGDRAGFSTRDVGVSWLPLFHDMGLVGALLTALVWHYPLLLMPVESFLLQPRRWLQWIGKKRGTMSVAPNFAYQLALDRVAERHLEGIDLSSWQRAFNGAEAVRPATLRGFEARFSRQGFDGAAFQPVYGMAENALAATFPRAGARWSAHDAGDVEIVSVGTPLSGVTVAVVDDHGLPLPEGTTGQIRLKSPSLMQGYFRNDEATAAVLEGGWLRTGDLGFVRDGELYVTGRAKELIIKRGRNYPPDDFERLAIEAGRGRVLRAAAFGAPNDRHGTEDLVVVLETRPLTTQERDLLTKEVNGAILGEVGLGPDITVVVPPRTIERTTSGKLRRAALKTRFIEGTLVTSDGRHDDAPVEAE
ncbi:MAG: fatty acyl-AMP ligase [Deltaproteobacteria bacterium]|nr:fatty acyl-AMP ligase [Deltaproteobacteria bacterium]